MIYLFYLQDSSFSGPFLALFAAKCSLCESLKTSRKSKVGSAVSLYTKSNTYLLMLQEPSRERKNVFSRACQGSVNVSIAREIDITFCNQGCSDIQRLCLIGRKLVPLENVVGGIILIIFTRFLTQRSVTRRIVQVVIIFFLTNIIVHRFQK